MKTSLAAVLLCLCSVVTASAQNPMREGRWEVTIQMSMPNMPMQMPATKNVQCVTRDQLKDPAASLPSGPDRTNSCKVEDYKTEGSRVSWKVACPSMSGTGEMTFKGDTYDGLMKMTTERGEMTMKMTGKRLGDCTQ